MAVRLENPMVPIKELCTTHELVYDSHKTGYEPKRLVELGLITPKVQHENVDYYDSYHLIGEMNGYKALVIEVLYQNGEKAIIKKGRPREPGFIWHVDGTPSYPNYFRTGGEYMVYVPRDEPDFVLLAACLYVPSPESLGGFSSSWLFNTHFKMGDVLADIKKVVTGIKSEVNVDYALHRDKGFRIFISNPTLERQERISELGKLADMLFVDKNFSEAVSLRERLEFGSPYELFVSNPTRGITTELQAKNYNKLINTVSNQIKSDEHLLKAVDLL